MSAGGQAGGAAAATAPAADAPTVRRNERFSRNKVLNFVVPASAMIGVLLIWAAAVAIFKIPDYLLPAPQDVVMRMIKDWQLLSAEAVYTLQSVLLGFITSVLIGVPLAFAVVCSRSVERAVMPFLVMSQTIPKVAIAPILVVWLGFGIMPKIAVVFLISFFPILVSTVVGLKGVESDMIDLVRSMGAKTPKIMLKVRGPSALPQMFAGFKIAICLSVVGTIVGEFVGSDAGLGYLLLVSTGTLDGTLVWAALFILIAIGMSLFAVVSKLERSLIPWHVSVRAEETAAYQS
jgi:NitT/TauT family transport system permease protein